MGETKRSIVPFVFYDRSGIEAYLERQARAGWMLEKIGNLFWHFRRIEPKHIFFCVVYSAKASVFDAELSDAQKELIDFCEHTGWKLAASCGKMQIFWNASADPLPIETDAALSVSAIHSVAKKSYLLLTYLLAGVSLLNLIIMVSRFRFDPFSILLRDSDLFMSAMWIMMFAHSLMDVIGYYRWHRRAKAAAALDGSFLESSTGRFRRLRLLSILCMGVLLLCSVISELSYTSAAALLLVLVGGGGVLGFSAWMKNRKVSAGKNRAVTVGLSIALCYVVLAVVVFGTVLNRAPSEEVETETYIYEAEQYAIYHDTIPLRVEDLQAVDDCGYSYENYGRQATFLMAYAEAAQCPRRDAPLAPGLAYNVTTVKLPFLYDWCKRVLRGDVASHSGLPRPDSGSWEGVTGEYVASDPAPWRAQEAYLLQNSAEGEQCFLLCYDRNLVRICFTGQWALSPAQMRIVGGTLGQAEDWQWPERQ